MSYRASLLHRTFFLFKRSCSLLYAKLFELLVSTFDTRPFSCLRLSTCWLPSLQAVAIVEIITRYKMCLSIVGRQVALHTTLSICDGREFIDCPARYKCPFENMLLKLRAKAEIGRQPELRLTLAHS